MRDECRVADGDGAGLQPFGAAGGRYLGRCPRLVWAGPLARRAAALLGRVGGVVWPGRLGWRAACLSQIGGLQGMRLLRTRLPLTRLLRGGTLALLAVGCLAGCKEIPGKPKPGEGAEELRPEQVHDFAKLYKENCAACHGEDGQRAASISLANPVYLAFAGEANIEKAVTAGIPGTLMPGFGKAAGGMLTEEQIEIIAHGMVTGWGKPLELNGQTMPPYTAAGKGDPAEGQKAFATFCASCHGADGAGVGPRPASIVDPAYLALVDDQFLRSNIVAGRPESGMPDWRSHIVSGSLHVMNPQDIEDIVAWLGSHRIATPGQPYQQHQ